MVIFYSYDRTEIVTINGQSYLTLVVPFNNEIHTLPVGNSQNFYCYQY